MKTFVRFCLTLLIVVALTGGALAAGPMGGGVAPCGMAPADCPLAGKAAPEQAQKFAAFQKDILPLKQQMMQLKTDLMGLKAQANPDWKAIADKKKQMVDVQVEIQKKAAAAGFPGCGGGKCGMGMCGMGMGRCGMMGGMGAGMGPADCPLTTPAAK